MAGPDLDDYIDVNERIAEFREKHPEGSLQQVAIDFRDFGGSQWVIFTAAAYRTPDDPRPGHGTAWEQVPGKTAFTKGSELQNAETSAWGRAIVAALAADTKRGIATRSEVRNRRAEHDQPPPPPDPLTIARDRVWAMTEGRGDPAARWKWIDGALEARGLKRATATAEDMNRLADEWAQASAESSNGQATEPALSEAVQS